MLPIVVSSLFVTSFGFCHLVSLHTSTVVKKPRNSTKQSEVIQTNQASLLLQRFDCVWEQMDGRGNSLILQLFTQNSFTTTRSSMLIPIVISLIPFMVFASPGTHLSIFTYGMLWTVFYYIHTTTTITPTIYIMDKYIYTKSNHM